MEIKTEQNKNSRSKLKLTGTGQNTEEVEKGEVVALVSQFKTCFYFLMM